ncbi:SDR family oxidoreductase [Pantoea sp. BAV 3049]|uniref:SDR family oxidoreductase n=1 Tax=Pantoea sp. BAV 3049 TaxID=2654188 RepID=UPI00131BB568|nr:SDR family oxidoreductase [Pantoea sp. BAV 3049]
MRVFLIGATGGVGRRLRKRLVSAGHQVTGLHRRDSQKEELEADGVDPLNIDLMNTSSERLAEAMKGCDVVVFSAGAAGAGVDFTDGIDGRGARFAAEGARLAGVNRFLLVSAFPDAGRGKEPSPDFEHYMQVKKQADVMLTATELDWVILRPGTLANEAGSGKVRVGLAIPYGTVPREDVAAVLHSLIEQPEVKRVIIELTTGEQVVEEAVAGMAAFSGR